MANDTVYRPYTCKLLPDARKRGLLEDTDRMMRCGQEVFLDLYAAILGGIKPALVAVLYPDQDTQLLCAVSWFRLRPVTKNKTIISSSNMMQAFASYYGEEPNEFVATYLTSNYDADKYMWVDCRSLYSSLCSDLEVSPDSLSVDIESMMRQNDIMLYDAEAKGWAAMSHIFGEGEKANTNNQYKLCCDVIDRLEKSEIKTKEEYTAVVFEVFGAKDKKEVKKIWSPKRAASLIEDLDADTKDFNVENYKQRWIELKNEKSFSPSYPNNKALKKYIENKISDKFGMPAKYHMESWSVMYRNALTDICTKTTRNYNFSVEQVARKKELEKLDASALNILNGYFASSYFTTSDVFVIEKRHIPNMKNLVDKYIALDNPTDEDINNIINDVNDETKEDGCNTGIVQLQRYVLSICKCVSIEQIDSALKINKLNSDIKRQKANPLVMGNMSYTYGKSAMVGTIADPRAMHNGKINGMTPEMWAYMSLYHKDTQEWRMHHVPFYHAKYYEEVYHYDPSHTDSVDIRTRRNKTKHTKSNIAYDEVNPNFTKKNIRTVSTMKNTHVNVDIIPSSFELRKRNGNYEITISQKIKKTEKRSGDLVMGFDQNQTRPNTYSIWRVNNDGGKHEFVCGGKITSIINLGDREIDVLSYDGVDESSDYFLRFVEGRKKYINQIAHLDVFAKTPENKLKIDFDCYNELNNIKEKQLYRWQSKYLRLLLRIIKITKCNIPGIKREIMEVVETMDAKSSLSHTCIENIRRMKSLIHCWFSYLMNEKEPTNEKKESYDKDMYRLLQHIEKRRNNKNKERVRKIAASIIDIAIANNVNVIVGEGELNTIKKGKNKESNARAMDWCAKEVAKKVEQGCDLTDITFWAVSPYNTSHQDPLEHDAKNKVMNPRMEIVALIDRNEWAVKKLTNLCRTKPKNGTTGEYYNAGIDIFCQHYNVDRKKLAKIKTIKDIQGLLPGYTELLLPMRGGRYYLASHCATSSARLIEYAGSQRWLCDADEIAAANIALRYISDSKKNKEKKKNAVATTVVTA